MRFSARRMRCIKAFSGKVCAVSIQIVCVRRMREKTLLSDQRANAIFSKKLQQNRMRHASIKNNNTFNALLGG